MRVNRNYVLTEYVLNENDCTPEEVEPNFLFCKPNFLFRFCSINSKKCVDGPITMLK